MPTFKPELTIAVQVSDWLAARDWYRVVGQVMGLLHPHGDGAIYDALVRMAQPWAQRLPLVDAVQHAAAPGRTLPHLPDQQLDRAGRVALHRTRTDPAAADVLRA